MFVATHGLYSMKPPTIIVPVAIKENVEKLFEVHRAMDQSELKHNLIGLNVGKVLSSLLVRNSFLQSYFNLVLKYFKFWPL